MKKVVLFVLFVLLVPVHALADVGDLKVMKSGKVFPDDYAVCNDDDKYCAEIYNNRAYKKVITKIGEDGKKVEVEKEFPPELKCTNVDKRVWRLCLEPRFFTPSTRIYFDTGTDDENEVDLFNDGNINVAIDIASIYLPMRFGKGEYYDNWSWGPMLGLGISSSGNDSAEESRESSSAPVVLTSLGVVLEYKVEKDGPSIAFEGGYAYGVSADESFDDNNDWAKYVGIKINFPLTSEEIVATEAQKN